MQLVLLISVKRERQRGKESTLQGTFTIYRYSICVSICTCLKVCKYINLSIYMFMCVYLFICVYSLNICLFLSLGVLQVEHQFENVANVSMYTYRTSL